MGILEFFGQTKLRNNFWIYIEFFITLHYIDNLVNRKETRMTNADANTLEVVIVSKYPVLLYGLREIINEIPGISVAGTAESTDRALRMINNILPQVVVLDFFDGSFEESFELLKTIENRFSQVHTLGVMEQEDILLAERILRSGGKGAIIHKDSADLYDTAIRRVSREEIFLNERLTSALLNRLTGSPSHSLERLSNRELTVFHLLGQGYRSREVASELGISIRTVNTLKTRIIHKLGLQDSHELTRLALEYHMGRPGGV